MKIWTVYIVSCRDGTLYTGCTNDLVQRVSTHNQGKGARYTRSRLPVSLVYSENAIDRSQAQKREAQIKNLTLKEKKLLISSQQIEMR